MKNKILLSSVLMALSWQTHATNPASPAQQPAPNPPAAKPAQSANPAPAQANTAAKPANPSPQAAPSNPGDKAQEQAAQPNQSAIQPTQAQSEGQATASAPAQASPAPAPKPEDTHFDIEEFQVDGNTKLDVQTVEKAVYPFLGEKRTIEDVERARQKLEALYREQGYATVLVDIPEQDVVGGLVKLQVVEGTVEKLKITGSRYYSLGKIRDALPSLAPGQVPHMPTVQAEVNKLSQQSADRGLTPVFRAGSAPGQMEAEIKVDDKLPLHGGLEINGMNTENTTRSRLVASLRYDNLWQRFHSASLQFQISPENSNEVQVWSGTYVMPVEWQELKLALYGIGISSNNNLGASVGGSSVVGTGTIFGARLMKPLPPLENYLHNFSLGVDYKDFDQAVYQQGQDTGKTPISYLPFYAGYEGIWRRDGSISSLSLGLHFSIRGVGNSTKEFEEKRYKARPDFVYLTTGLKHQHELPWDMRLAIRLAGQVTDSPLISNEQFAMGGWQTVRGYYQTQQLGDNGLNTAIELYSPNFIPAEWVEHVQGLRALTFFDWGYLWIKDPLPKNPSFYALAGTGAGLRLQVLRHLTGELDVGFPLYKQGTSIPGSPRIDFRMAYEF